MSLNIDINRILPVKVSGDCPEEVRRLLILSQSCNDVNPGKNRFSTDNVIIFVQEVDRARDEYEVDKCAKSAV